MDAAGETVECEEKSDLVFDEGSEIPSFEELKTIAFTGRETEGSEATEIKVEFRIWKQGQKVNIEALESKLCLAIKHALWELVIEKNLLPYHLFAPNAGE